MLGYAVSGYLLFGAKVEGFHTIETAFISLTGFLYGDFDYQKLYESDSSLSAVFFGSYMVLYLC